MIKLSFLYTFDFEGFLMRAIAYLRKTYGNLLTDFPKIWKPHEKSGQNCPLSLLIRIADFNLDRRL